MVIIAVSCVRSLCGVNANRDAVSYLPRIDSEWVGDDARAGAGDGGFSWARNILVISLIAFEL